MGCVAGAKWKPAESPAKLQALGMNEKKNPQEIGWISCGNTPQFVLDFGGISSGNWIDFHWKFGGKKWVGLSPYTTLQTTSGSKQPITE